MSRKLERARHLIRLATDDGAASEEARTAAITACRIIKAERFRVVDESESSKRTRYENVYDDTFARPYVRREPSRAYQHPVIHLIAEENDVCWQCSKPIRIGDRIAKLPGKAWCHVDCVDR